MLLNPECLILCASFSQKLKIKNPKVLLPFVTLVSGSFLCVGNMKLILFLPESDQVHSSYRTRYRICGCAPFPYSFLEGEERSFPIELFRFTRTVQGWSRNPSPSSPSSSLRSADLRPVCRCLESHFLFPPAELEDTRCDLPLQRGGQEHHCHHVFRWVYLHSAHGGGQQRPAGALLRHQCSGSQPRGPEG